MKSNLFNALMKAVKEIQSNRTNKDMEMMNKVKQKLDDLNIKRDITTIDIYINLSFFIVAKIENCKTEEEAVKTLQEFYSLIEKLFTELSCESIIQVETLEEFFRELTEISAIFSSSRIIKRLEKERLMQEKEDVPSKSIIQEFKSVEKELSNTTYKELLRTRKISSEKIVMLAAIKLIIEKIEGSETSEELIKNIENYLSYLPYIFEEEYGIDFNAIKNRIVKLINENQEIVSIKNNDSLDRLEITILKDFSSSEDNDQELFNLTK